MSFLLLSKRIPTRCIPLARTLVTSLPPKVFTPGRFAIAFDIDGVLLRGPDPHPSAKTALTKLQENDIPFILLTNGGGLSEVARCEDLSSRLDFPIAPSQLVQSHTPAKNYTRFYETILVVGGEGENCRKIAEEYGFKNVFIPDDFYATDPHISPFSTSPPPAYARNVPKGTKIDAIFVFNDPRDWALSTQVIIDFLRSDNGVYGTLAEPGLTKPVPTFFTNSDMVWASKYHMPRLGQGAFKEAVLSIFPRLPGASGGAHLRSLGKPTPPAFRYAQRLLEQNLVAKLKATSPEFVLDEEATHEIAEAIECSPAPANTSTDTAAAEDVIPPSPPENSIPEATPEEESSPRTEAGATATPDSANRPLIRRDGKARVLERVYMIGDSPESDIRGANRARINGTVWWSILVRSGVWREPYDSKYPTAIVDDVLAAVDWAMENEQKIKDGVALEKYPSDLRPGFRQPRRKRLVRGSSPGSGGKVEVGDIGGEESARLEKTDGAMKEKKGDGALGGKRANGESGSDSD